MPYTIPDWARSGFKTGFAPVTDPPSSGSLGRIVNYPCWDCGFASPCDPLWTNGIRHLPYLSQWTVPAFTNFSVVGPDGNTYVISSFVFSGVHQVRYIPQFPLKQFGRYFTCFLGGPPATGVDNYRADSITYGSVGFVTNSLTRPWLAMIWVGGPGTGGGNASYVIIYEGPDNWNPEVPATFTWSRSSFAGSWLYFTFARGNLPETLTVQPSVNSPTVYFPPTAAAEFQNGWCSVLPRRWYLDVTTRITAFNRGCDDCASLAQDRILTYNTAITNPRDKHVWTSDPFTLCGSGTHAPISVQWCLFHHKSAFWQFETGEVQNLSDRNLSAGYFLCLLKAGQVLPGIMLDGPDLNGNPFYLNPVKVNAGIGFADEFGCWNKNVVSFPLGAFPSYATLVVDGVQMCSLQGPLGFTGVPASPKLTLIPYLTESAI